MRKILSIFAVLLVAITVSAQTPSTDFAGGYAFVADNATLDGAIELYTTTDPHYLRYNDNGTNGTATWQIEATKACKVTVTLNATDNVAGPKNGGHIFEVKVLQGETEIGSVAEAAESSVYTDIALDGEIKIPAAGVYSVKLFNNRAWSKCGIKGVTLAAEVFPETDFAAPDGYLFAAEKAALNGNIWYNETDKYLYYNDKSVCGTANWKIHATRGCLVNVTLNNNALTPNGHKYKVYAINDNGEKVDSIAEPSQVSTGTPVTLTGELLIPAAGDYTIQLYNQTGWSSAVIDGIVLTYAADVPKYYMKGNWNDENPDNFKTKEMVCVARNKYILENVVFGTKGVNWGDDPSWSYGHWETVDEFLGAKPTRLDTVTLALDASTGDITCTILGKYPKMVAKGFDDWGITRAFEIAADEKTASLALNLTELKKYEFKLMLEGQWRSNEYVFNRANNASTSPIIENYNNMKLDVDKAGEYLLTWKFEDNSLTVAYPSDFVAKPFEINLREAPLGSDDTNPTTKYLAIDDLGNYSYTDAAPAEYNAILSAAKFNGTQHGYVDLVVTTPIEAGSYKLTLGGCQYQNNSKRNASITNEDGSVTYTIVDQKTDSCYHQNTEAMIVSAALVVDKAQTIKILCAEYTPYIKLERAYKVDWESAPEHASYYYIDKNYAAVGEIVTVTVDPDEGYFVGSVDVPGVEAEKISWVGNTITFPMPAADVEVSVTLSAVEYGIVIESMTNGSIEANKAAYTAGETVTLTIKPAEGYKLSSLGIENVDAADIHQEGNTVTFPMPAKVVTVSATFVDASMSLTAFLAAKPETEVLLKDLTVVYANGKNTYVIDADGVALLIYDASKTYYDGTLAAGKVLSGQKGTYKSNKGQEEIIPTNTAVISDGTAPVPTAMSTIPTNEDVNKYVSLENLEIAKASDGKYYYGNKVLQVYGSGDLAPVKDGHYDIEGIIIVYNSQLEISVTKIELKDAPYVPTGAGTEENPYTVTDVLNIAEMVGTEEVWVKGFVVSVWATDKSQDLTIKTNIALADNAEETEVNKMIPVQLKTGTTIQDELNYVDNNYLMGLQISVKGKLQKYFSVAGVKELSDYKKPEKPSAIDNAEVNAKAVKVIENGQMIIIKNGVKYNALGEIIK